MFSPGVPPPPAARGGVSYRTRRSFCRIRFELTPRGLRLKNTYFESTKTTQTSPAVCRISPGFCLDLQKRDSLSPWLCVGSPDGGRTVGPGAAGAPRPAAV
ncbi:hypothetical protein PBY51_021990 [Eleginops maclovinus]|uniref:Uncharacterized protein n=1 Tax=Eleginops maclovinus TaxID=56733 RepID=A0AAN7XA34_ELEMC|nr:hypothetical protein PBY51_021990 [Eleginops maclovinus]